MDTILKVSGLYKKFCKSLKRSMLYGTHDMARSMLGYSIDNVELRKNEFWALQDINFELKRGETLGLIGQNGCGKTTLLRLINGIFPPDKGRIEINGRIGALIAVGAGFHPYMTGRENIYLNGIILGMSKKEIDKKFDEIIDFAEIGDFIDSPVSTYSSGMTVRLGFAIAIHCEPDILLLDEILAVGDAGFQLKCFNKIGELRNNGVATLFVSHDLHNISTFSNQLLLLQKGKQIFLGNVSDGLSIYKKSFTTLKSEGEIEKVVTGTKDFKVLNVTFNPPLVNNKIEMNTFDDLEYSIEYEATRDYDDIEIDTVIYLHLPGSHYFQANNRVFNERIDLKEGKGKLRTKIKNLNLNNFQADLFITLWHENKKCVLFWWRKIPLLVNGLSNSTGWTHYNVEFKNEKLGFDFE